MSLGSEPSGRKTANAVLSTDRRFYYGAILISNGAASSLKVYNCGATGDVTDALMVGECSTPATAGHKDQDKPMKPIECPDGVTCMVSGASAAYHVRTGVLP